MISLELIPAGVAVAGACIAIYTDLRRRIIPNKLNFPMIIFGVVFYLLLGLNNGDFVTAISGVLGAAVCFGVGYALWLTGGWAGGDVKLFTALGALLYGYSMPVGNPIYPIPFTILFNSIIAIIPVLFIYALVRRAQGQRVLYDQVKIIELKEGMIPAETIYEKDGKIGRWSSRFSLRKEWDKTYTNTKRASGLTRYQVGALKKLVRARKIENHIKIKKGLPFAPALGAGVFIAVFYGDIYWQLLFWLFGYV